MPSPNPNPNPNPNPHPDQVRRLHVLEIGEATRPGEAARGASATPGVAPTRAQLAAATLDGLPGGVVRRVVVGVGWW